MYLKNLDKAFSLFVLWLFMIVTPSVLAAQDNATSEQRNDTLLMFVGEDIDVLSIASRRQETAWQAPAVAQVITRNQIQAQGFQTLAQALESMPGFYMGKKEWGIQPYLRGIPNSALILYDTVPTSSDVSKSQQPLGYDLSLNAVKRIEVVRGPGSVLWGPDAFAGIVNVVPMSGKDIDGIETGVSYGAPGNQRSAYINSGYNWGVWDAFLSTSFRQGEEDDTVGNLAHFWGNGQKATLPEDRFGNVESDDSQYLDIFGRIAYRDRISISGRISDFNRPYAMSDPQRAVTWQEDRSAFSGFLKFESNNPFGISSAIKLVGIYSWLHPELEVIDRTISHKEDTVYGEVIYDKTFFSGSGMLTGGISFREKGVKQAPIWDGYLPEFLVPENIQSLPIINLEDYKARLFSIYGQYTHKLGNFDFIIGARNDDHDAYQDHVSFSLGTIWSPNEYWIGKLLYGTAYRTPFARQLIVTGDKPDLEKIKGFNAQIAFKPSSNFSFMLCGFASQIENHIMEDPYAGLSVPNSQDITGLEADIRYSPWTYLDLNAIVTLMDNSGPDETYLYNDATFIRPDGSVEKHYLNLNYPFDAGPASLFQFRCTLKPWENVVASARLKYVSERSLIYPLGPQDASLESSPDVWLLDINGLWKDTKYTHLQYSLSINNVFDERYTTPGTYSNIEGDPVSLVFTISKTW